MVFRSMLIITKYMVGNAGSNEVTVNGRDQSGNCSTMSLRHKGNFFSFFSFHEFGRFSTID